MIKKIASLFAFVSSLLLLSGTAMAHVVVQPSEVGIGKFQTFTIGVPNEKEIPTVALRIVLPSNLNYVTPTSKAGWNAEVKKTGEGETAKVTEISWSGGVIPEGFREEFSFSAQAPAEKTSLVWKAYQTYEDGTVVAWDQPPAEDGDHESAKPYSETKVINDITEEVSTESSDAMNRSNAALALSIVGLALGATAVTRRK